MKTIKHLNNHLEYDRDPDSCSICHQGIQPHRVTSNVVYDKRDTPLILQLVFTCPRRDCQRVFIGTYLQQMGRFHRPEGAFYLRSTSPYTVPEPSTPKEIKALSPNYHQILSQSQAAEHRELDQIAGVGYRKALEFLVKDYASLKHPDMVETIRKAWLLKVISDFISDANIKACSARATWLGNDEAHYTRKFTDKDIGDLKTLIRLTEAWVLNDVLTEQYLRDINPKKE